MGQITGKGLTFDNGRTIDNFIWQFYLTSSDILGEDLDVGNPHQAAHPLWHIAVIHDSIEACESMNTVPKHNSLTTFYIAIVNHKFLID